MSIILERWSRSQRLIVADSTKTIRIYSSTGRNIFRNTRISNQFSSFYTEDAYHIVVYKSMYIDVCNEKYYIWLGKYTRFVYFLARLSKTRIRQTFPIWVPKSSLTHTGSWMLGIMNMTFNDFICQLFRNSEWYAPKFFSLDAVSKPRGNFWKEYLN